MGVWLEELRPYAGEPRTSAGWRLAKSGWRLLRHDRTLLRLTLLLALALALPATLTLIGTGEGPWGPDPSLLVQIAVDALAIGLATFFLVAFSSAVDSAVDGLPLEAHEALDDARQCLGPIVAWTVASAAVWTATHQLAGSAWPLFLVGIAWYVATLFVVPAMAIDRLGAVAAVRESWRVIRAHWREAVGGLVGLGALAGVAFFVPGAMLSHAAAIHKEGNGTDYALMAAAMVLIAVVGAVFAATKEAFAVLLMREALDDLPGREYSGRRLRRRAKVGRVLGAVALALALLVAISAINRGDRETLDAASSPGATYEIVVENPAGVDLPSGSVVFYRGSEVGVVLGSHDEEAGLSVTFHVEPGIGPDTTPGSFRIVRSRALGPMLVLIPAASLGGPEANPA